MVESGIPNSESQVRFLNNSPKPQSLIRRWCEQIPSIDRIKDGLSPMRNPGVLPRLTNDAHDFFRATGLNPEVGTALVLATLAVGAISLGLDYLKQRS